MTAINYDDVISQLQSYGLEVSSIEIGRMRRVKIQGSREKKGWYSLFEITKDNGESLIVGSYGIWQGTDNGAMKIEITKQTLTDEQKQAIKLRMAEDKKRAKMQRDREISQAAKRATSVWLKSLPVGESEYLTSKNVQAHGVRFTDSGSIVIPMMDNSSNIFGLQFILPADHPRKKKTGRNKEFWPAGMQMKGNYFIIGGSPADVLLVAEGYATAATLHEQSGLPVAIAFNANNLLPVCQNLKKRYKRTRLLVCADDDYLTDGNPGKSSAEAAAVATRSEWVSPVFSVDRKGKKLTDFNDLQMLEGAHVVQKQLETKLMELYGLNSGADRKFTKSGGGGEPVRGTLKSLLQVDEAVERYSLIYGAGGTMYDHQEYALIPKSDVLDICVDHAWREWKLHPLRSVVRLTEVGFDPTETDKNILCNLWGGWPTKPKSGECSGLLSLLSYLCQGEEKNNSTEIYDWVLKWLAYLIQNPGAKMKTALIFHGPQGAGKNLFFESYAKIFGKYARIVGQAEIDDKFNDWASGKLFMIADEVVARQELFHIKNKLKALITGDTIRINPKNVAAHDEKNHVNLVFLSNEKQPLVLEKDDRRYVVIWTPGQLDRNDYKEIADEVANGGIEALHDYLLNLPLGDFNEHSRPPVTKSKEDLIEINLESSERFLDLLIANETQYPICPCCSEDLYKAYSDWARRNGVARPRELSQMMGNIAKMPGWSKVRARIKNEDGEKIQRTVVIPPMEKMPEKYQKRPGEIEADWLSQCCNDFKNTIGAKND